MGGEGSWYQREATCKGGVLFACSPPPQDAYPLPLLVLQQNSLSVSHSLFLPGLCVLDKGADATRKGTPAKAALSPAEPGERG